MRKFILALLFMLLLTPFASATHFVSGGRFFVVSPFNRVNFVTVATGDRFVQFAVPTNINLLSTQQLYGQTPTYSHGQSVFQFAGLDPYGRQVFVDQFGNFIVR